MATLRSSKLGLEQLENRCLLNGTISMLLSSQPAPPIDYGASPGDSPDLVGDSAGAQGVDAGGQSIEVGVSLGPTVNVERGDRVWQPALPFNPMPRSASSAGRHTSAPDVSSPETTVTIIVVQITVQSYIGSPSVEPSHVPPDSLTIKVEPASDAANVAIFAPKHLSLSAATTDEGVSQGLASVLSAAPGAKNLNGATVSTREYTGTAIQNIVSAPQVLAKDQAGAAFLPKLVFSNSKLSGGAIPPAIEVVSHEGSGQLESEATVASNRHGGDSEARVLGDAQDLSLSSTPFELTAQSSAAALASMLPFDFESLETSITDFFNGIKQLGATLSPKQIDVLFSAGMAVAATMMAVEVARRRLRPSTPVVALRREGAIPYSDCL